MKRILSLAILTALFNTGFAQPIHREDFQTIVFRFNNVTFIFANQEKLDPHFTPGTHYMRFPFPEKGFTFYGFYKKIIVTHNPDPFIPPFASTSTIIDTSEADAKLMNLKDLEITRAWRNIRDTPVHSLASLPEVTNPGSYPFSDTYLFNTAAYSVIKQGPTWGDTSAWVYTLRNTRTRQDLFRWNLYGAFPPIAPKLGGWIEDSSKTLVELGLEKNGREYHGITPSEEDLKQMEKEGIGKEMKNEKITNSTLTLFFHGSGANYWYKDSTVEYQLNSDAVKDTGWRLTGHRLLLTNLRHGQSYTLRVRYRQHPKYINEYTFSVSPLWYQSAKFKWAVFVTFVMIGFTAVVLVYRQKARVAKRKREQLSLELKAIRSQLNPHFIFNAMNSIQALVNKNDIAGANKYLAEFSTLLRESLINNNKEMMPLSTELKTLETYISLEQLRFHFHYELQVDDTIDKHSTEIPALLLQPIVENAIKHGISALGNHGWVQIRINAHQQDMQVRISDNGAGFVEKKGHQGFGLHLTQQRINLVNKSAKEQAISMKIEPSINKGTTVHLIFKNWL